MIEEQAVMGGLGPGVVLGQSKHQLQMILSALNPTHESRQLISYLKTLNVVFYWDSSRLGKILRPRPYFCGIWNKHFYSFASSLCDEICKQTAQVIYEKKKALVLVLVPNQPHSWLCISNIRGLHTILCSPNQGWAHSWYLTAPVLT